MGTSTSNNRVETVHHIQDQIFKLTHNILLDHNQLTIIQTEINHDDRSHKTDFLLLEIKLINC